MSVSSGREAAGDSEATGALVHGHEPRARAAVRAELAAIPHVVIVGCGFGGLYAARALDGAGVRVTLIDRTNHHCFQPLLYQVATAGLTDADVAAPIRGLFRKRRDVHVLMGEITDIDPDARRIRTDDGLELDYDYLIVAAGTTHNYFGHPQWQPLAPGLKTLEDAYEMRRRMLLAFELAERTKDPRERDRLLRFVIVGAGPTGVELAGAIREIARRTLARDFRNFDPRDTHVILIDAVDRVLPSFPEDLSRRAREMLERRGVEVRTRTRVLDVRADGVVTESSWIASRTVFWAAGLRASPLARATGAPLDRMGRALVEPDLSVPGHPEIFVIGDLAAVPYGDGTVPGVAPAAIQAGEFAAAAIRGDIAGAARGAFEYRDRGSLATVGRRAAVFARGRLRSAGTFAWLLWLGVHLIWLIGFRNRLAVLFEWAWAYFTHQRSARLILQQPPHEQASTVPPH